jgi:hypothetical protein
LLLKGKDRAYREKISLKGLSIEGVKIFVVG